MNRLGKASLITYRHETGVQAQGWALNPWIPGLVLHMGKAGSPLPPAGSTVDRGMIRIDTGTGEVWRLVPGDPPPALGPTGGPKTPQKMALSPMLLLAVGLGIWFALRR